MSNTQDDIKDIVAQLQWLQIEQSNLLRRIEQLNESTPPNATRPFAIGDLVRIKNLRPLQANKGTIVKIGSDTDRITVQARGVYDITRATAHLDHPT